jgi:hypothetical protein
MPSDRLWPTPRDLTPGHTIALRGFYVAIKTTLSAERQESRAKGAVANFLFRELIVPKVFFDAHWPERRSEVDVMAVDRSGAGDVHVVEVKVGALDRAAMGSAVERLLRVPGHFKYLALFENKGRLPDIRYYATDGLGRVGIIQVREDSAGNLSAEYVVRPERFRFDLTFKQVDKFTASHSADIEIRP